MAHGTEFLPSKWETGIELLVLNFSLAWVYEAMWGMNRQMGCVCMCVCIYTSQEERDKERKKYLYKNSIHEGL